ncbi:carbohydrate binding domain-containing protein [Fibrobacter sp. UWEL]|uniref:carbohydrate binding domain-containing protein n=1 Tax=Fibrobacter sp. UWEL TaxID=1896209 RepID=UPI00091BDD12|nr:carbohydrate binding domain-containing protein [Fibrobacter sp. UWEL]SHK99810.1 polymorphic outer membrane protein repeat-containing protein [Fibrobacter sp. UWEL]
MKEIFTYLVLCGVLSVSVLAANFPYSEWNLANYNGAFATFSDGLVSINNGGSDYWNVQLTRKNIELQSGKTYEVKFFLQGVSARRYTEIRIGRDGFPYDAFAEFGEVVATVNGREVTKTFRMNSGNVSNARLEFNFGKSAGSVYFSDVSLNCLDCGNTVVTPSKPSTEQTESGYLDYVVVANTIDFRDNSKALGNVVGGDVELGVESKIYGDVSVSDNCFLRERAYVVGDLRFATSCTEQNDVYAATKIKAGVQKPSVQLPEIVLGTTPVSVNLDGSLQLVPGNYGAFYANTRAKVRFSAGTYSFQNFYTEPDAEIAFDMTSGPISIAVAGNVRFGDRNKISIVGGNPSEITWNVAGETVDFGTDGLYFGKVIAPNAFVRIPSRTHLVGGVYANKFLMEPQSTVSQEPRADEISHSEEHFGPFFNSGVYRYNSVVSTQTSNIEMFVYADDVNVKVNGGSSKLVELSSPNQSVVVSLTRDMISGFPVEASYSNYVFDFSKSSNYRVYWNPQTLCKQGCDGSSATTAIGDFETVLSIAKSTGREINMAGGTWNAADNYKDGVVPWMVGFEIVGNTTDLWELNSENDLPMINLGKTSHIQIEGESPRSLKGLRVTDGINSENGGALNTGNQKISLKNVLISNSGSAKNGGAIFSMDTLNLENVRFANNYAAENGGAVFSTGKVSAINTLFLGNSAAKNGGAISVYAADAYIANAIFYSNGADVNGGALYNSGATLNLWNATFFANKASAANGAIGGAANGVIGNSIFWKNTAGCNTAECGGEVVSGYSAVSSSFTKAYPGTNNFAGDPKFIDESKPAGENMYMGYDAGINLSKESVLLKAGIQSTSMLRFDILNMNRPNDEIALGAYAYANALSNAFFGVLDDDGNVVEKMPAIPLITAVSGAYYREYIASTPYSRVWKVFVQKHKKTNKERARVKLWVKNRDGEKIDEKPIEFDVYKNGEEHGQYVFQTMTKNAGKPVLFTKRPQDAGNFDEAIVIYMSSVSDYFYYEAQ